MKQIISLVSWICLCILHYIDAKSNRNYYIPGRYCGNPAKEIDGAVITHASVSSSIYSHSACIFKVESSDNFVTSKRIQLRVKYLQLSCASKLKIYDGSGTLGTPKATLTCKDNNSSMLKLTTSQKYLSLRLENNGDTNSQFSIVLTTFKSTSYCSEFRCSNGLCIDKDLRCDGVDHCGDRSDETSRAYCYTTTNRRGRRYYSFSTGSLVGVVISGIVLILIISVFIFICKRRQRQMMSRQRGAPVTVTYQSPAPPAGTYPTQGPAQPTGYAAPPGGYAPPPGGYAPPPTGYSDPNAPAAGGYPPQYPPLTGYPAQPGPGYPPSYAPAPPGYYQATQPTAQPPYPVQEQK